MHTHSSQALIFTYGTPVDNAQGERIGRIEDVAVDKQCDKFGCVMISGDRAGVGEEALPLSHLAFNADRNAYELRYGGRSLSR